MPPKPAIKSRRRRASFRLDVRLADHTLDFVILIAKMSAKIVAKRALGRPSEIDYLSGFLQGVLGGLKFDVDRTTLLYTEKN